VLKGEHRSVSWAQAELGRGNAAALIGPLTALTGEYPLVEPLAAVLMHALSAAGHRSQALDSYAAIRARLAEELGVDPGAELQRLHRAILRGEVEPAPAAVTAAPPPGTHPGTAAAGRPRVHRPVGRAGAARYAAGRGRAGADRGRDRDDHRYCRGGQDDSRVKMYYIFTW